MEKTLQKELENILLEGTNGQSLRALDGTWRTNFLPLEPQDKKRHIDCAAAGEPLAKDKRILEF